MKMLKSNSVYTKKTYKNLMGCYNLNFSEFKAKHFTYC